MDKSRSLDVRRRNREILERANAELRSERKISRFPLSKLSKDLNQLSPVDLSFYCHLPAVSLDYIRADHSIHSSVFTKFGMSEIFLDSVRAKLLVNDEHLALVDLLNVHKFDAVPSELTVTDARLLSDAAAVLATVVAAGTSPVHHTATTATPAVVPTEERSIKKPRLTPTAIAATLAESFNKDASLPTMLLNPVTKRMQKVRRIIEVLPMHTPETLRQVKFDEAPLGEQSALIEDEEGVYKYYSTQVATSEGTVEMTLGKYYEEISKTVEEFYVLSIENGVGKLGRAGWKTMVKKMNVGVEDEKILIKRNISQDT
jgi:hypothetical protein